MNKLKIRNRKQLLLVIVYVLLLGHFLFSGFVVTLGPSYTFDYQNFGKECAASNAGDLDLRCIVSCLNLATLPTFGPAPSPKGFPVTLYYSSGDPCYGSALTPTDNFDLAMTLDILYIAMITVLFGYLFQRLGKDPKNKARRHNRRVSA